MTATPSPFATPAHRSRVIRLALDHAGYRDARVRTGREGDRLATTVGAVNPEAAALIVTRAFPTYTAFIPANGAPAVIYSPAA
jgi:hypothetical protein